MSEGIDGMTGPEPGWTPGMIALYDRLHKAIDWSHGEFDLPPVLRMAVVVWFADEVRAAIHSPEFSFLYDEDEDDDEEDEDE